MSQVTFIGHVSKDILTVNNNKKSTPGGGVYFGSGAFALCSELLERTNVSTNMLTIGTETDEQELNFVSEMKKRNVTTTYLNNTQKTTSFENIYKDPNDPDSRIQYVHSLARPFEEEDLNNYYQNESKKFTKENQIAVLNPLWFGEFPSELFSVLKKYVSKIVIDAQGFVRHVTVGSEDAISYSAWDRAEEFLPYVDLLKVDIKEATYLTGIKDPLEAMKKLGKFGVSQIICSFKEGAYIYDGSKCYTSYFGIDYEPHCRTGRGDTLTASYALAHYILLWDIQKSLDFATKITALKMTKIGALSREVLKGFNKEEFLN
ncbi:ketohexokinase [Anaeramoeba flamelloides]|uniref:Ketohexokinase n=1 Tax=Anaeramoeba flamelloides TaxID=1746091 RepID=A0AAV7YG59_9EUKA|nr:ketohexokinase [Anaeramoeba flamelloides]